MTLIEALQLAEPVVTAVFAAGGAWVGIASRLAAHESRISAVEARADRAHQRLDNHLETSHG